jgi:O-antigen ligase
MYLVLSWILMLPFVFFAVHGNFSFELGSSGRTTGTNSLAGIIPHRNFGVLGYVVVPGIVYAIVACLVALNFRRVLGIAMRMRMLSLLALLTVFSGVWSQSPMRSSYNGIFYLADTLFAFYLVLRFEPEEIMAIVQMAGVFVCFWSLILIVFFPQYGVSTEDRYSMVWKGIFIDRTTAAKCLVFLVSPALVFGSRRFGYLQIAYICFVGIFIVMAHAITSLVVLSLYALFMAALCFARKFERRTVVLFAVPAILVTVLLVFVAVSFSSDLLHFLGREPTLTGRTELWGVLLPSALKRPFLGYGFYAYWLGLQGESANAIVAAHWFYGYAHNGILEILLQLGFVGLAMFLVTLFAAGKNAWFCLGRAHSLGVEWYIGLIFLTVLYNIDEATVVLPNELLSILYVVACTGLVAAVKRSSVTDPVELSLATSSDFRSA